MKNYKEKTIQLGESDIASLVIRTANELTELKFGGDGIYKAYIVEEDVEIPSHYTKVFETKSNWTKIYDDEEMVSRFNRPLEIYRAGEYSCIIRIIRG